MSVQDKINDSVVRTDGEKNDRLYVRVNSDFKKKLLEKAKKQEKGLSAYILGIVRIFIENEDIIVRTIDGSQGLASNGDVRTIADHSGQTYQKVMKNRLLQDKIDSLMKDREALIILAKFFNSNMKTDSKFKQKVKGYFTKNDDSKEELQKVMTSIKNLRKGKGDKKDV